ncbi:MAG: NAD(P)/FAD-dependent oxidoreductase [Ruthenibacterium lactatiformans]
MPVFRPAVPSIMDRTRLCAGEAAGFLNPMGEGVSAALESGHHAAGALVEHWNEPERALARYRERTNALRVHAASMEFTAGMAETFGDEDVRRPPERRMTGKTAMNASKTDGRS